MARIILYSVLLSIATLFASCSKSDTNYIDVSVDPSAFSVPATGGKIKLTVNTTERWNIFKPADVDWITDITPATGIGSDVVTITIAANALPAERSTLVKVFVEDVERAVTVTQATAPALALIGDWVISGTSAGTPVTLNARMEMDPTDSNSFLLSIETTNYASPAKVGVANNGRGYTLTIRSFQQQFAASYSVSYTTFDPTGTATYSDLVGTTGYDAQEISFTLGWFINVFVFEGLVDYDYMFDAGTLKMTKK